MPYEEPQPDDDTATVIKKLIEGLRSGEIQSATMRVVHNDGTIQDLQVGYETEDERDEAMARLLKMLGELH